MGVKRRKLRRLATGLAFLAPNILGFLTFTLVPLVISFVMAFTNWDVHLHNIFRDESVRFVGLENFRRLLSEPDFGQYLGNTFYFMLGIPFAMAGSLVAALLLSQDLRSGAKSRWARGVCVAVMIAGLAVLVAVAVKLRRSCPGLPDGCHSLAPRRGCVCRVWPRKHGLACARPWHPPVGGKRRKHGAAHAAHRRTRSRVALRVAMRYHGVCLRQCEKGADP